MHFPLFYKVFAMSIRHFLLTFKIQLFTDIKNNVLSVLLHTYIMWNNLHMGKVLNTLICLRLE
jgi:hypothetical protein